MFNISSNKQAAANRANSALSTGPRTAAGKAASSQNAISHGLCSATVTIFSWESRAEYDNMRASYIARFRPIDQPELDLVDRLLDSTWRRRRAVNMETTLHDLGISELNDEIIEKYGNTGDQQLRLALSFSKRHGEGVWDALTRHIAAAERGYQRAQRELRILQGDRFNQTSPDYSQIVENLASPAQPQPEQPQPQPEQPEAAPEPAQLKAKIIEFAERSHLPELLTPSIADQPLSEAENIHESDQYDQHNPDLAA